MEQTLKTKEGSATINGARVYTNVISFYHCLMETGFEETRRSGSFIIHGNIPLAPAWLLYISVVKSEIEYLINQIAILRATYPFSIAVPEDSKVAGNLLDGTYGLTHAGKLITISTDDSSLLDQLARQLVHITSMLSGPEISDAYYLGGRVYTMFEQPFFLENGIENVVYQGRWPFSHLKKPGKRKKVKRLGKYVLIRKLKHDIKGDVYKGVSIRNWFNVRLVVVKQGKAHQSTDEFGRDIRDRLNWQAEVHARLQGLKMLPEARDLFNCDGENFFVMDFIDGTPYHQFVCELLEGVQFASLDSQKKLSLIHWAMELTKMIGAFHRHDLLHRDISPMNFIVESNKSIKAIDVELTYDLARQAPDPWFTLGTEGYMSPQQRQLNFPAVQDDIYGLGGVLIFTFTGISPSKFEHLATEDCLFKHVNYFIRDRRMASMIAACRSNEPSKRPGLEVIVHTLDLFQAKLLTNSVAGGHEVYLTAISTMVIEQTLRSLADLSVTALNPNKLFSGYTNYVFNDGITGVLYAIIISDKFGADFSIAKGTLPGFIGLLIDELDGENSFADVSPGLFQGTSGIALVLSSIVKCGLLEYKITHINAIASLLSRDNKKISLSEGLSGQALAMIKSAELTGFQNLSSSVLEIAEIIINQQNRDGSWNADNLTGAKTKVQATGLFHGVAGIVYFLIVAHEKYHLIKLKKSAEKGLEWLVDQRNRRGINGLIQVDSLSNVIDPWIEFGFTGVAFLFLKVYEFWNDDGYLKIALELLLEHPKYITSNFPGFTNGLAGLGEVYLEAYRIINAPEWRERAQIIGEFLMNTNCNTIQEEMYWLEGNDHQPYPGFGAGNAGILHFLTRLLNPEKVEFPLIDFRP